jgi:SET domain-containing protein
MNHAAPGGDGDGDGSSSSSSGCCNVRKHIQHWPFRAVRFFAARDIAPGEELQWDYGEGYWVGREADVVRE